MSRKDEVEEKTDRGKASKRAGAAGAIARGVAYTRARFGNGDGGVPVVSIVVLVAIAAVTFGVLAAPGLAQAQASGSVELSGTSATSSTSWSYNVSDLESVEGLSVELEGRKVKEPRSVSTVSESGTLSVEPRGTSDPENAMMTLTGARETSEQSAAGLSDGDSISVGGNTAPESESVTIEGAGGMQSKSQNGLSDGSSLSVDGNAAPSNEQITVEGATSTESGSKSGTLSNGQSDTLPTDATATSVSDASITVDPNTNNKFTNSPDNRFETDVLGGFNATTSYDGHITYFKFTVTASSSVANNPFIYAGTISDGNKRLDDYAYIAGGGSSTFTVNVGSNEPDGIWVESYEDEGTLTISDIEIYGKPASGTTISTGSGSKSLGDIYTAQDISLPLSANGDSISMSASNAQSVDYSASWTETFKSEDISVSAGSASISDPGPLGDGQTLTASGDFVLGSEPVSVSSTNPVGDVSASWTEDHRAHDPSVTVDGSTVSHTGPLGSGETETGSVDLSTGSSTVSVDSTGPIGGASVEWTEVTESQNPSIELDDGTTLAEAGTLAEGSTVEEPIDLSTGTTQATISSNGPVEASVEWTDVSETVDPSMTINGQSSSYSGTLAEGQSTSLDVSDNWIQEGSNTVEIDMADAGGGPKPQVGLSYSHSATTTLSSTTNSTTWSEDTEVSRTFATDQQNVTLSIPMPDNVVGIDGVEERRGGGSWSSVSSSRYQLDGTDVSIDMGDVATDETIEVRAVGAKTRVRSGAIEVLEPTTEGNELSTRMRVTDAAGTDPVEIEVSETAAADRVHYIESAEWSSSEYHLSTSSGTETLYLPSAVEGSEATVETAPISMDPTAGDVRTEIDNVSAPRFTIAAGSTSGDDVEVGYLDTTSGDYYELYSVTEERQVDMGQASSPVYFSTDDREATYEIRETEPPDASIVAAGPSGGGGLPSALLLLAGLLGVGGTAIVSQRLGLGRRVTVPVAIVAAIGIAELGTSASVISTLSNDLIRSSSTSLIAALATAGGLVGAWVLERRTRLSVPSWVYLAIGVAGSAWLATATLGDSATSIVGVLVGGAVLAGTWAISRRWDLPRWLLGIVGAGAIAFMIDSVAPSLLEELLGSIADGASSIAPLVVLGLLVAIVVWLRRRGDSTEIVVRGDS